MFPDLTQNSARDCRLPRLQLLFRNPAVYPLRPAGVSEEGWREGLPLLLGPRGAEPAVPGSGRATPAVSLSLCGRLHWDVNRAHSTPWRRESLRLLRKAARRLREFLQKLFFKYLGVSEFVGRFFPTGQFEIAS